MQLQVGRLLEGLAAVAEATRAQVEKRAAMSFEELQAELAEAEEVHPLSLVAVLWLSHCSACYMRTKPLSIAGRRSCWSLCCMLGRCRCA